MSASADQGLTPSLLPVPRQPSRFRCLGAPFDCNGHDCLYAIRRTMQHPRCESALGCVRQPTFGWEGEKARFCSAHKVDGMLDVKVRSHTHKQPADAYVICSLSPHPSSLFWKWDDVYLLFACKPIAWGCNFEPYS